MKELLLNVCAPPMHEAAHSLQGSYIRTLREARGLSREEIAASAGTSGSQVERIENGKQETRSSVLFGLARAVRGNVAQLQELLLDEAAAADDGVVLAKYWLVTKRYGDEHRPLDFAHRRVRENQAVRTDAADERGGAHASPRPISAI